ncbi:MAG: hypothetical protein H0U43_08050, partial [Chthoniobacterales bacterium]|nr:hypothetical protein [Chthoniobacterales bacterium]
MSASRPAKQSAFASFHTRLLVAMMVVVVALTVLGLFLAQRKVQIEAQLDLEQDFRNELATLHGVQEMRHAALAERCRALVQRPRIHAALEDNALDLLYLSAQDELRDIVQNESPASTDAPARDLSARFYRFLDSNGAVISPSDGANVGELNPKEEAQLALRELPESQQIGYIARDGGSRAVDEIIAVPINSTENGEVIAALVFGFKPVEIGTHSGTDIKSGIWVHGRLDMPALPEAEQVALALQLDRIVASPGSSESSFAVEIGGVSHLLFYKQLNPGSAFPPAYEVAIYSLANAIARQQQIRHHVLIAGACLFVIGLIASHLISRRLSAPVEALVVTSEENRTQRQRAEAALESTNVELQRSARFSADASHQLKTPVTVLRAGIEELLARD